MLLAGLVCGDTLEERVIPPPQVKEFFIFHL
jgi:hypothetical protein